MSDEQYQCKPGDPTPFDKQPPAPPASDATPFQRLQAVADLDYNDSADEQGYRTVTEKIQKCRDLVTQYEQNNGFQSQEVRAAITEWAQKFRKDLRTTEQQLTSGYQTVGQARSVMRQARDLFQTNVSPDLYSTGEKALKATMDVASIVTVPIGGSLVKMAADAFWDWLGGEREKERNEYCQKILDDMNNQLTKGAEGMNADTDGRDWKKGEGDLPPSTTMPGLDDPNKAGSDGIGGGIGGGGIGGGAGGYDPSTGLGGGAGAGGYDASGLADGGTYGASDLDDPYAAKGKDWMSEGFQQPGALQDPPPTATVDDLDGVGLVDRPMNQTVTPNGLVDGYAPPSATNYSDPRWDPSYKIPSSVADVSKAASAGTLGALGGAGAASALKGLGGAGAVSAKSLLAGGGLPGAGGLGAAGAGGAGSGGAGSGAGAAGLKGASGLKGAGSGTGGMMGMGGAGAGAGGAGDDKKKKRRAFSGLFADQPDDMGPVWDPAHGPGSEDDGVVFEVDLDEWGL